MQARDVKTVEDARQLIEARNLNHIKVGVFDIDGVMRGKYMCRDKFFSALEHGFGFCDVVLGWDVQDQLYDNAQYTGWHTGFPDAKARIVIDSCRDLPFEVESGDNKHQLHKEQPLGLFFLAEFSDEAEALCPRNVLQRVLSKAESMGFDAFCGFEYEFFVFDETPQSVRDKQYQQLQALAPAEFGYSVIRNSTHADLYRELLSFCDQMDFELEGLHEETGPGVLEAAIRYDSALNSADKAAMFKTFSKVFFQRRDKLATFMARWSEQQPGQSGHIHISLRDCAGRNVFFDGKQDNNVSATMASFVAGQQQLMPELMAMIAPTINSYRRIIPGYWAPTHATVGIDNRTCALRILPGSEQSQRLEYRIGAADANPYLILAAAIASGLYGIENNLSPAEQVKGNAYQQDFPRQLKLPNSLGRANERFSQSDFANNYFGEYFVEHFSASRDWEEREFAKHISQWELNRYFEII